MRDFRDSKTMAQSLRAALAETSITVTHSQSLELIAKAFGLDNWNILAAKIEAQKPAVGAASATEAGDGLLYCSFCGKSQREVAKLIAGPNVAICGECVGLCDSILLDGAVEKQIEDARAANPEADLAQATAEALRSYSEERLLATQKSFADWLEHIEWSLREADRALSRDPATPWEPDEVAKTRRWIRRGPFGEQSHDEIRAAKAQFETYRAHVRERSQLVEQVLKDRGVAAPAS